ncbi:hypothetical protein H5410_062157 [Solanum commersonii]|uniref:DUF4283 domain-containing protein n=1 Tax=Solanum commersonii TaxID=4109 RepID=A0A9J5WAP9_SOLCO|nr:hypothetical protein H5410_062157 [Solanum commersonii]
MPESMIGAAIGQSAVTTGQLIPLASDIQLPSLPSIPIDFPNVPNLTSEEATKFNEGNYATLPCGFPIPFKMPTLNNGVLRVTWTDDEVKRMNALENLQYAVIRKFSYGWPQLGKLRKLIPSQCNIKGADQIGLLRNRRVLIRMELYEDFVNMMARPLYYISDREGFAYPMRPLIYDEKFKVTEKSHKL